tara:strand:- start:248 stop:736 length:489 start_codon:yes stop_codon:yes gene_type:complete
MRSILFLYLFLYLFLLQLFLCVSINETFDTIYKNKYEYYKNKYKNQIHIEELARLKSEGIFYYTIKNGEICNYAEKIFINRTNYYTMYLTLIHELTHYFQCIYSNKMNKNMSSIHNHILPLHTIQFIEDVYKKTFWNMEYEAFYYQKNSKKFKNLEEYIKNI